MGISSLLTPIETINPSSSHQYSQQSYVAISFNSIRLLSVSMGAGILGDMSPVVGTSFSGEG